MNIQMSLARFRAWSALLIAARKRYEGEVRAIHAQFLPMLVLSLVRPQLEAVHKRLFKKPATARTVIELVVRILEHKNREDILRACLLAQRPRKRKTDGKIDRSWWARNRERLRVGNRLLRLLPAMKQWEADYRKTRREEINANSRAWWAAKSSEEKDRYMKAQWKRREARLKADPNAYEEIKARKRERYARIVADPIAGPIARKKQREKDKRMRLWKQDYERRIKADPVRGPRRQEQKRRGQRQYQIQQALRRPGRAAALAAKIRAMVPERFPPQLREDLCQELTLSYMAGEATLKELPAMVRRKATKTRKLLGETWNQRSLDDHLPGSDRLRLIDTIPADQPHF